MAGKFRGSPENQPIQHFGGRDFTPTDENDLLGGAIVPKVPPSLFRIQIALGSAAKFYADVTRESAVWTVNFNSNTNLTAGCLYIFDMLVGTLDTGIVFSTNSKVLIGHLTIQEILVGTQ